MGSSSDSSLRSCHCKSLSPTPLRHMIDREITHTQMGFSLCAIGFWMWIGVAATPDAVVIFVIIFNAAFGFRCVLLSLTLFFSILIPTVSWGPLPWLYPPEIMPLTFRAKGVSLSTATNWAFNTLVGAVTPYLQEVIEWRLYFMHGFFCACSFILG